MQEMFFFALRTALYLFTRHLCVQGSNVEHDAALLKSQSLLYVWYTGQRVIPGNYHVRGQIIESSMSHAWKLPY